MRQRREAEVIEELFRRRVNRRLAWHITVSDHPQPFALEQRTHDVRTHRNPADIFDFAARDRLPVGDDCERFEQRARIARLLLIPQPVHPFGDFGPCLEAVAAAHLHELDTRVVVVIFEFFERGAQLFAAGRALAIFREQGIESLEAQRSVRNHQ